MRSALIIAADQYADPGLRRLRAPASDARALAAVLENPEIGDFQVRTLLNEPAYEVNLAVEEFFADRRPDDLLLLYFSAHGVKDQDGQLYFAASNTRLTRLGATAVAADFVNRLMNRSRSRQVVLLLDCFYAGAFERGMTARAGAGMDIEEQFGGRGRAVITASSAMEYAFEGSQLADTQELLPSVFTSALVEGLETGEADRDQDGLVGLDELYDYVYDRVRAVTPNQTPGKWAFGVHGELVIARHARPVTTPAPLPPELQEAIESPLAAVRAGAVPELARLLGGRHAGLALAARLTLERLADDDSRVISAAAAVALDAELRPDAQPGPVRAKPEADEQINREADAAATRVAEAQAEQEAKEQAPHPRKPKIFLCYRREDTQWAARSIYESLATKYSHEQVFRDIDSTPAGVKFSTWIELRVGQCDVMIVLIGDAWSSAKDQTGKRRLDLPKDWVRQEIETALRRDIPIIPVRVQGARMPSEDELPPSIAEFTGFQSAEITDSRWTYDVGLLIQAIDDLIRSQ
jgi:hypothetical protein